MGDLSAMFTCNQLVVIINVIIFLHIQFYPVADYCNGTSKV